MDELTPALYRAGHGPPLVLLHGFTGTWGHWRPLLGELASGHEVIAPTISGHYGGPPYPADLPTTMEGGADALERRLDELGVEQAHFVGNSMGGSLALEMAKRGRALSVVAIAPGGGWEPGSEEPRRLADFFERQVKLARAGARYAPLLMSRPLARKLALREVMRRGDLVRPEEAVEMSEASWQCEIAPAVVAGLRAGGIALRDLDRVSAPVLMLTPAHDRILPPPLHAPRLRREIPGVVARLLEGCGHVPMWDAPRTLSSLIADFVAANAPLRVAT